MTLLVLSSVPVASEASAGGSASTTRGERILGGLFEVRSLDGRGNNRKHPEWGSTMSLYPRVGPANYVDGIGVPVEGPPARYLSNRVFNDNDQPLYSPRDVSQWGFVWGQFLDHTYALRLGRRGTGETAEQMNIPYDNADPLEEFPNDLGVIDFTRSTPEEGTGVTSPREQINQHSSFIDALAVYGADPARLEWMREGPVNGNPDDNSAKLMLPGGYLPRRDARGDADTAPNMVAGGVDPATVAVAGDPRANENPPLLAVQTLFAREHNRIVDRLPKRLPERDKFEIARAVVGAQQQYITYNEFLPTLGVRLPRYTGYKPGVDATLTNEFATVGYRAHSFIRGEFQIDVPKGQYTPEELEQLRELGVQITDLGDRLELVIPLTEEAFFNPSMLTQIQLGPMLQSLSQRAQNANDEQITNLLRSFTFVFPVEGNETCAPDPSLPACIRGVNDLGAADIARGRDHGMPSYNELRKAYGLAPKTSFKAITGERTEHFPRDPELTRGAEIDDPDSMDIIALYDKHGRETTAEADNAVRAERRTTLAARLKAIYGSVDNVDPFIGMIAEKHLSGAEFGETQMAIWKHQFVALRDGDRFYYQNHRLLEKVKRWYGIDYRVSLGDVIARNTGTPRRELPRNVFLTRP
ncbi:peroxidase family protein [Solwaraspora sp. WMMA2056]|uniref:peroxidase family protein n=1 Tax=Solwaraspora sp. WMMA2056 TaxID=3015161 RepID=UPI00259B2831|nr:peroxidase family protein [Solwaraspora sp. WMMA2056]WJK43903.1 peroxidase family protein [Solwaraspora sp. WMMA2056]